MAGDDAADGPSAALGDDALAFAERMFDLARDGDAVALGAYVDAGLPVDLTNAKGDTLLILAAYHDHTDAVAALLARGADVERTNDRGQTALVAAAFRRSASIVAALLRAGADPSAGAPSAVDTARFFDYPDVVELLQRGRAPEGA